MNTTSTENISKGILKIWKKFNPYVTKIFSAVKNLRGLIFLGGNAYGIAGKNVGNARQHPRRRKVRDNRQFAVAVSLAIISKANVYLWLEKDLHLYVRLFKSWGLNVCKVVCVEPKSFSKVDDVEVISAETLFDDKTPNKFIFISGMDYAPENPQEFWQQVLAAVQFARIYFFNPNEKKALAFNHEKFDIDKMYYYQSHKVELMELFDSLADETSKLALYFYVESFVRNVIYRGEHTPTRFKYFFGGKYERLYKHLDDECWINCGASTGDTIFAYFSWEFKPKKIYAFEATKARYDNMLQNLSLLPPDKSKLVEPINELIDEQTDFKKILAGNKCTLLNADIEGAELNLLRAMKNIIQSDRPVISICVYHFKEDILAAPQFLQSICRDYVYYLRKYTSWHGFLKRSGEIVLYAVPVERSTFTAPPHAKLS